MIFCIFSYNRATHLAHCIQSITACCDPAEIWIFDDNSDDAETLDVLATAKHAHKVLLPQTHKSQSKHGGLYANMQQALESLPENRTVCFLQDDMQLVRKLTLTEQQDIDTFFAQHPKHSFIHPAFLKLSNRDRDITSMQWHADLNGYTRNSSKQSAGVFYSDIFISNTAQLKKANWHFQVRESANELQAQKISKPLVFLKNPFLMWRPNVAAYRGKQKTWALKHAEKIYHAGFYPIHIMTEKQNESFVNRKPSELPIAEDYLTIEPNTLEKPWHFHPLEKNRILKHINKIELTLNKLAIRLKKPFLKRIA